MVSRIFSMTLLSASAVDATEQPPHLLFMMADQMRWDSLSASAGPENNAFRTPALDRLAAEGATVRYAWSSTPTCTPARAALLTGRSPWNHGMLGLGSVAPRYELEMPRFLAEGGYQTASIGKDHFGWDNNADKGIDHGYAETILYDGLGKWKPGARHSWSGEWDDYDRWFAEQMPGQDPSATLDGFDGDGWNTWHGKAYMYNESLHPTAWVGRNAVEWLRAYPNATTGVLPFMLKVSFHRPHSPYDPPQRLLDAVGEDDLRPRKMCDDSTYDSASDGHGAGWCARFRGGSGHPKGCGPTADAWCGEMPSDEAVVSRRAYAASVNFVDEWVGHIYDVLAERNLLERTWILWTSDHGDGQGDMHHWRKGYPYEFSAHVPMLLRWPESWAKSHPAAAVAKRGVVFEAPLVAELRDVFHTMADAAGLAGQMPSFESGSSTSFAASDGKSLLCLLADPTGKAACDYAPNPGPWRQWIDMEHGQCYNATNHWSALTDGRMKYIQRAWAGDEQLFNLTADPSETTEVSRLPEYAEELALWRARLVQQFQTEGRGAGWVKDGQLVPRAKTTVYSPHYPKGPAPPPMPAPSAGDVITMHSNGGTANCGTNDCWRNASIGGQESLVMIDSPTLCLSLANDTTLEVQVCSDQPSADQHFSTTAQSGQIVTITHAPSGRCIGASKTVGTKPQLVECKSSSDEQRWTFGTSGRLCAQKFGNLCLRTTHQAALAESAIADTFESAVFV